MDIAHILPLVIGILIGSGIGVATTNKEKEATLVPQTHKSGVIMLDGKKKEEKTHNPQAEPKKEVVNTHPKQEALPNTSTNERPSGNTSVSTNSTPKKTS